MTQAVGSGGSVTYTYNGDGLKVQRVGPEGATRYYYDGIRPIWETDGAGAMTAQLDRDIFGNLLSRVEPGSRRYYHTDGLGSIVALTDETGATAASMLYDAWGNVRLSGGTGLGKYRFTGAELDTASDLYHMGARFYDPSIGRWLSEDPVQSPFEPMSLNFYAYVANNPLVMIDPMGSRQDYQVGGGSCDAACQDAARKEERAREVWDALDSAGIHVDLDKIRNALDRSNPPSYVLASAPPWLSRTGRTLLKMILGLGLGILASELAVALGVSTAEFGLLLGIAGVGTGLGYANRGTDD